MADAKRALWGMFHSSFEGGVDAKKRVSVPAAWRKALGGQESVFLWPSLDKTCLEGGGAELVSGFERAIGRLKPLDPRKEALSFAIFGRGRHYKFDEGGRIVLEADHLEFAGVAERVRFVGLGDRFQIWAPATHESRSADLLRLALDSADLLDPFGEEDAAARAAE